MSLSGSNIDPQNDYANFYFSLFLSGINGNDLKLSTDKDPSPCNFLLNSTVTSDDKKKIRCLSKYFAHYDSK